MTTLRFLRVIYPGVVAEVTICPPAPAGGLYFLPYPNLSLSRTMWQGGRVAPLPTIS